ncbi:hypothetical protein G6F65_020974 [Rhizopus arrhizus]|nr:hypothetical protein G6F68_019180 [Rhizopus microsporus]KAG1245908.1 hypothetical protein G6F65_020974 [Rhizopus arrhizus]
MGGVLRPASGRRGLAAGPPVCGARRAGARPGQPGDTQDSAGGRQPRAAGRRGCVARQRFQPLLPPPWICPDGGKRMGYRLPAPRARTGRLTDQVRGNVTPRWP